MPRPGQVLPPCEDQPAPWQHSGDPWSRWALPGLCASPGNLSGQALLILNSSQRRERLGVEGWPGAFPSSPFPRKPHHPHPLGSFGLDAKRPP